MFAGFLLAPLPAGLLAVAVGETIGNPQPAHRMIALFAVICLLLYGAEVVFGIAISTLLRRRHFASLGAYALGGLAMSSIPNLPYTAWSVSIGHPLAAGLAYFALIALYGTITGCTFWAVTRPDRSSGLSNT